MRLLKKQQLIASDNLNQRIFVEGVAGTGKTTAAIERIKTLIKNGAAPGSILVLVPQISLALPYTEALRRSRLKGGANIQTATLGRLTFLLLDLFWPLVAEASGVAQPFKRPVFLTLEMMQYAMTRFVEPEITRRDYFNSVHIQRSRLYTQIVDNLNKAALVGFPADSIGQRLKAAWAGDAAQAFIYDDAQTTASLFRAACLQHNLLDFSLQAELFRQALWPQPPLWNYLRRRYRHLIVDNLEEDAPLTHDFLLHWLPYCESAVLITDTEGGYRRFLGADPVSAQRLKAACDVQVILDNHRVMSADLEAFQLEMARSLKPDAPPDQKPPKNSDPRAAVVYADSRYQPQMLDWAAEHIAALIHDEGVPPREIVVLSAFLPDALRFALQTRLDERGVPHRSHRPSRALRDEPAARALLTLARLAHPDWGLPPNRLDVTAALALAVAELDPVRARLLSDMLYRDGRLLPFERIQDAKAQGRVTYELGARYEKLRGWLDAYRAADPLPLDVFFSKLFGEVLSQPRFGFHQRFDAARTAANLIDSAREFRHTISQIDPDMPSAAEYVRMVDAGAIANLYVRDWASEKREAVLLAPAYTFLMSNQPVDIQFWLNVGSPGWGQRLNQPLTQPYVLSRHWETGRVWTDQDEYAANQEALYQLAIGLIRRCRQRIYIGFSQFGEQGLEQRGPLLMALHSTLRRLAKEGLHV
jgi:hypothetical protein